MIQSINYNDWDLNPCMNNSAEFIDTYTHNICISTCIIQCKHNISNDSFNSDMWLHIAILLLD